jgi:D-hexose-6-phosphate mutarotase
MTNLDDLRAHVIPGRLALATGESGLPKVVITTPASTAEIYLHGAHVTHFQKHGDEPLLFLSRRSGFGAGVPIRGGIPICHPWFGPREGGPAHGLARLVEWRLASTSAAADGSVTVSFALPRLEGDWSSLQTTYTVTVSDALSLVLTTQRASDEAPIRVESCLHTYFHVRDVEAISLTGVENLAFDDFAFGAGGTRRIEHDPALRIVRETNRVYPDHPGAVEVHDRGCGRVIRIQKAGSQSTVIWNPWTTQKMPEDFDQAEYRRMVCVESGNIKQNAVTLGTGETTLAVVVTTAPIDSGRP